MSYLAAMLLLYMEPFDAFAAFANLMHYHYFLPFFRMSLPDVNLTTRPLAAKTAT